MKRRYCYAGLTVDRARIGARRRHGHALAAAQAVNRPEAGAGHVASYLEHEVLAGVALDDEARRFLRWIAGGDHDTTAGFVGIIHLVAEAQR